MNKYIFLLALTLLSIKGYTQEKNDDYILLHKIVNTNLKHIDSVFYLQELGVFNIDDLNGYYRFKSQNEIIVTIYEYNKEKDTVLKLSDEKLHSINEGYYKKFAVLDSVLKQNEYDKFFQQNAEIKWEKEKLNKNIKLIQHVEKLEHYAGTQISKPLYTSNHKYALIWFKSSIKQGKFIIYRKENDTWEKISEILNVF